MHFPLSAGLRTRHFWPMLLPLLLLLLPPLTLLGPSPASADLLQPDDEESSHQQQPRSGNRSLLHSSLDRVPVAHPTLLTILVTFLSCVLFFMICSMLLPLVTGGSGGGGGGGCRQLWRRLRKRSSDSEKFESSVAPTVAPMKQSTLTLQPAPRLAPTAPCSSGATFTAIQCPVPIRIIEAASDDSDRESCVLVEDSDNDRDGGGGGGGSGGGTVAVRDSRMSSSTMRQSCGQPGPKQHCASTSSAAAPSSTLLCGSAFCYRSDPNIPGSRQQQQQQQQQLQQLQQRQLEKSAGTGEQEDSLLLH